jgi:hypothetical protein
VVWSYRRQTNWVIRSWVTYNSRLIPALPTRKANTSFWRHVSATRHSSITFRIKVAWSLNRCYTNRWIGSEGSQIWPPRSPEIADTRWTLITAHHGRCCSHTEQLWKRTESNTWRLKRARLCIGNAEDHFEEQTAQVRTLRQNVR